MIKYVTKRNGETQQFDASKINGWGEWAAKTLGRHVDWSSIVLETVSGLHENVTTKVLQEQLIKSCLNRNSWSYNRMAGRLYVPVMVKSVHGDSYPKVKELHSHLVDKGLMIDLGYSDSDYDKIEKIIDHSRNLTYPHYQLSYIQSKYALQNKVAGIVYETPQFVYMRMAMHLSRGNLKHVEKFYNYFSKNKLSAPTPNYTNLGTKLRGYASCCVITTDDTAASFAAHDHAAYTMTYSSAGIGSMIRSRSLLDPVKGGAIKHLGKLPLYAALGKAVKAMTQNSRGGSATTYYNCFDPEVLRISMLKNPLSTEDNKNRDLDYALQTNMLFAEKVAKNEDIFLFNCYTAPDLYEAFYTSDELFKELYVKYENDDSFNKTYISARELLVKCQSEAFATGRAYLHQPAEANRHTPFIDTIYSSNLCLEINLPTKGYTDTGFLYRDDVEDGEIALCSLAGTNVANIESDEEYEDVMYYALLMIDECIHLSHYALPNIGMTAKSRLNAGVGMLGNAELMARKKLKYSSQEGKNFMHEIAEKHMYFAIKASLKLGKERGNAPWIDRTKWPDGWMPIDTYNRNVDNVVTVGNKCDWESLRAEVVANGGIRNSCLVAHMPTESSSKAAGTTNGVYPARDLAIIKTDADNVSYFAVPDSDKLGKHYELAWDIDWVDMLEHYGIIQKFTDQGISADLWHRLVGDTKVGSIEMIRQYLYMMKLGVKSRYYLNSKTSDGVELDVGESCLTGGCKI